MRRISKRKLKKNIFLITIILILIYVIVSNTLSLYESNSNSTANLEIAFSILKEDYYGKEVSLGKLIPRDEPYVYTFSISNNDGTNIAEVNMDYDLKIRSTTNLPLRYELYKNENYNTEGAQNIILKNEILPDEYGTYFRTLETEIESFGYTQKQTNIYNLVVYFPTEYNSIEYQDLIESIEIIIEAKQRI